MANQASPPAPEGGASGGAERRRRRGLAAVAALAAIGVAAYFGVSSCSSSSPPPAAAPKPPQVNPLTGIGTAGRVLTVKIDNVGDAQRQQTGLNSADLVYVVQVEGGLSRYLAVFDGNNAPARVGPVRSARQTDIPLLAAYGRVGLVYSGAITGLLRDLGRANLQNINPADAGQLFSNGGSSPTYIAPRAVYAAYPQLAQAQDVGFRFGALPSGGKPAATVSVKMPAASFTFTAQGTRWLVSVDGSSATTSDQGPTFANNVIVQHVNVVEGKYTDHNAATPANEVFSETTGHGFADFYRDGQVWHGTWSKPADTSPTSYAVGGVPFHLMPGRTWIVLLGTGFVG